MPMDFDKLKVGGAYTRDDLERLWGMHLKKQFFNERDGRVALFATQHNDGGRFGDESWANALDERRGEFIAQVNPERAEKAQRIREATNMGLFYRLKSPDAFIYKGRIRYRADDRRGPTLYLVLTLLDRANVMHQPEP